MDCNAVRVTTDADIQRIKKHWETMNNVVYPAIRQQVESKQRIQEQRFNDEHLIRSFSPGDIVMFKDQTRGSKWNSRYEGPVEIVKCNQGGAYIVKDGAGNVLDLRIPPKDIKPAPHAKFINGQQFYVKKILEHRGPTDSLEYLVQWEDPDIASSWITPADFQNTMLIERYWRNKSSQSTKSTEISTKGTRERDSTTVMVHRTPANATSNKERVRTTAMVTTNPRRDTTREKS
jgi:hypothetical protein